MGKGMHHVPEAKKVRAVELLRQNLPYKAIAERLGISQSVVGEVARAHGLNGRSGVNRAFDLSLASGEEWAITRGTRAQREWAAATYNVEVRR